MQFGDAQYYYGGGGGVQYAPAPAPVPVPQVSLPVRSAAPTVFNASAFKLYGAILALMAAATLSLGIANVVLTKESYCNPWTDSAPLYCSSSEEPYIWTWVASGIWASIPIFFAGLFAMCLSSNPGKWTRVFALLIFLSAIVFAPGMAVLSSIEVWRGSESKWNFYKLDNGLKAGNIMPDDNPYQAKFALPLVIAIIALIMFIMTGIVTLCLCCCMHSLGIYLPQEIDSFTGVQATQVVQRPAPPPQIIQQAREVYYPGRPQIKNYYDVDAYRPASDPYARFSAAQTSMPTRYNPMSSAGGMYGNFASRVQSSGPQGGGSFASEFFKPNPAYFWQ